MKKKKLLISLILTGVLLISQVAAAFAAPTLGDADLIAGTVQAITLETDSNTGIITVLIEVLGEPGESRTVRIGQEKAMEFGLVVLDENGNLFINEDAMGLEIEIDSASFIPNQETTQHPVGNALAVFFSDITGLDYDAIMSAHEDGDGFGVIAQALWLTRKLEGDAEDFTLILQAKQDGEYSNFIFEDGTSPTNWAQFRRAVMGGDTKGNLGIVMSSKDKDNGSNNNGNSDNTTNGNSGNGNNKDKEKDKSNNGKDNGKGKKP
ncbi:MAG: hypothetical protein ABI621_14360 [Chloroflexota bacterium]